MRLLRISQHPHGKMTSNQTLAPQWGTNRIGLTWGKITGGPGIRGEGANAAPLQIPPSEVDHKNRKICYRHRTIAARGKIQGGEDNNPRSVTQEVDEKSCNWIRQIQPICDGLSL